ncbi:MAG TPA: hypothetical protein VFK41_01040 [Nocardioidaceae bacterium]|nr:hypothetical protein [Nocardioidaceae bacterium]
MTDNASTVANPNRTRNLSHEDLALDESVLAGTETDGEQAA